MIKTDLEIRLRHVQDAEDDWTKQPDQTQRKRLQNRLAQRKRRALFQTVKSKNAGLVAQHNAKSQCEPQDGRTISTESVTLCAPSPQAPQDALSSIALRIQFSLVEIGLSEHRYLRLTQYSNLRAQIQNMTILGLEPSVFADDESLSPWTIFNPFSPKDPAMASCPLMPTLLQLSTWHHPFVDLLPSPSLRDNILSASLDDTQEEQLCYDLHLIGFTIWGSQPWDPIGWEVSQEFVDNWSWLLDSETIRYSNFWRTGRGEPPLNLLRSGCSDAGNVPVFDTML
ncbi:hypothetical protein MMC11_006983 [Xylographa trunciseda]|nr:hypothetical protein [Xylographa trunciseda]